VVIIGRPNVIIEEYNRLRNNGETANNQKLANNIFDDYEREVNSKGVSHKTSLILELISS
jgi:hypothetical protein